MREKHATVLGVYPSVLSQLDDYPVWQQRTQRHPNTSRSPRRGATLACDEDLTPLPRHDHSARPADKRRNKSANCSPQTLTMRPFAYEMGSFRPLDVTGRIDRSNPASQPHPVEATHQLSQEDVYPFPSPNIITHSSFDQAFQINKNLTGDSALSAPRHPSLFKYLPCIHDMTGEWGQDPQHQGIVGAAVVSGEGNSGSCR